MHRSSILKLQVLKIVQITSTTLNMSPLQTSPLALFKPSSLLVSTMGMNRIARALAPIVKAHVLTAFEVVNTHECSSKVGKANTPVRRGWNKGREHLSVQVLVVTEGISDTAEAETKGSQSAVREQIVFPLNSQFSLMKRLMSHHCSDGSHMPRAWYRQWSFVLIYCPDW